MTQKGKLKELIDLLEKKGITELSNPDLMNAILNYYEVTEKTGKQYLREMVLFNFIEWNGKIFQIKKMKKLSLEQIMKDYPIQDATQLIKEKVKTDV